MRGGKVIRAAAAVVSLLTAAFSCSRGPEKEISDLLLTVPSRSVAVMQFGSLDKALPLLTDSTSVFRRVDYGRLSDAAMVLSYDYSARLIPLLAIDAGHASGDTSRAVAGIIGQARSLGLCCSYTGKALGRRAALLLSPSESALKEAEGHIRAGASILDAKGFADVAAGAHGVGMIVLRGGKAARWLPSSLPDGFLPRRKVASFLDECAEWIAFDFDSYAWKNVPMRFYTAGRDDFLADWMLAQKGASARVGEILPEGVKFLLDLPLASCRDWYAAYRGFLDSRARLSRHNGIVGKAATASGITAAEWLQHICPQELALVRWEGSELLLLRSRSKVRDTSVGDNPAPGMVQALFGSAFAIADDSCMAKSGHWIALGSAADVSLFAEGLPAGGNLQLPSKDVKFVVWNPEFSISGAGDKVVFNLN